MRSSPTGNNTLLRIQQEISEVAARENELRNVYTHPENNGVSNGNRSPSPLPVSPSPPPVLTRAVSTSALNSPTSITPQSNGVSSRRFIPNTNATKGVMQKFFKTRGKISTVTAISNQQIAPINNNKPLVAWQNSSVETLDSPAKALIPTDKPLRKGYVPVEERIQKELREMKHREQELRTLRRKSQPDLMAALEAELESNSSRSSSPIPFPGKLRNARSFSQLLDEDLPEDTVSAPSSLRPARSLAQLCDALDQEIESPRSLIKQWETRIKESQDTQI